jgi:hypothetical protein
MAVILQKMWYFYFILILFINQKLVQPLFAANIQNIITYVSVVLCLFMGVWVLNHLPLIDFRPFKVGNIEAGMKIRRRS